MHLSTVGRRREGHPRERRMCTVPPDASKDQQPQDLWLMSAMIKWITSQFLLTREGAGFAQMDRQQSTVRNVVFVCASSLGKAHATASEYSTKSEYREEVRGIVVHLYVPCPF